MISRRELLLTLGAGVIAAPLRCFAQAPQKIWRIGFISTRARIDSEEETFRQSMRELGYVDGRNVAIESRYAAGNIDEYSRFAAEFVRLKVDCMITRGIDATLAAKLATSTIPIIMTGANDDPVRRGLVASLARPGANVTGFVGLGDELSGKRLQLLKEILPKMSRMAVLWDRNSLPSVSHVNGIESSARRLGMEFESLDVGDPEALPNAFRTAVKLQLQALIVVGTGFMNSHQARLARFAIDVRLPVMYTGPQFTRAGGLMCYASDPAEQFRQAASYVDRILKGAKPGELPVAQPTKFEFIVNLKAAKQIGLTIPREVLARADRVIE